MTVSTRLASSLILTALFTSQYAFAEAKNNLNQPVKLNHATVFLHGAELDNDVTLSLNKGQNKVILTNIAHNVDPRTLSVNLNDKNVIIRSVNIQTVPTEVVYPENIKALQTQQKQLMQQIEDAIIAIKVGEEQLSLLKDQRFFGENNAQSLEQSSQKLDFIRQQMTKILQEQQKYQLTIDELEEKAALLQAQIDQNMPASLGKQTQVVMSIDAPEATTAKLQLSYLTQDAAWSPSYDIRSQNTESPIVLTYKADVIQNTGIDWENIDLTLSTINPSKNITPFDLQPWRLSIYDENKQLERQVRMKPMPAAPVAMYEESMTASKKKVGSGIADFVTTANNGISLNYQITLPFTLKSTSKPSSLTIKQEDIAAKYKYTATPKLAEDVFLQADIENWQALNLLNGNANIYYGNTYIGNVKIDANRLTDTLQVPFGIDKNIQISRENNEKMKKKPSFIGSTVEQKESYLIKAKNIHPTPVKLTIYDQLPISEDSDIKVSDVDNKDAVINKKTGKITWNVGLKPNEEIQIPFSYTLSYPKDKHILGL
ncbi:MULTISPECIES: DUF4139 domain-containing protein [Providencia]|uniref:DUF4139 domain-containing protein n=1 Tax=Providencia TaxID=586 RepID=UPI001B35EB59|nr:MULTISPECIES: DUF4139 domain-containing protein [Providencia]MBQ0210507.1 DUF4139 domain-containing protein [Providencia rettgeri]MDR9613648.1 DUF4139 domain-containing protein [Providencia rettgeri]UFK92720.1 DUF4139 domain-containing protein [Providencia rettgeri]